MSFLNKKWIGIAVIIVIAGIGVSFSNKKAEALAPSNACPAGTQLYGWGWSSNIGWISFNSKDATAGGGPYCVAIDDSNNLVGWAWSSNIGWIKFGGLSGFPTASGASTETQARIASGQVFGWARACAGTVQAGDPYLSQMDYPTHKPTLTGDCSTMTSRPDGWDGWIELSNSTHPLAYTGTNITGYAWGSDVVGWIVFDNTNAQVTTNPAPPPTTPFCQMSNAQTAPGVWSVSWGPTSNSAPLATCSSSSFGAAGINTTSGSRSVSPTTNTTYSVMCTGVSGGTTSCSTAVTPGVQTCQQLGTCTKQIIQMWLNNDSAKTLSSMTVRLGTPVKMNWEKADSLTVYAGCNAFVDGTPITDGSFTTAEHKNPNEGGTPYIIPATLLPAGQHSFSMSCSILPSTTVPAKTFSGAASLNIQIKDPTIEEI
jgi:hypothetical protein